MVKKFISVLTSIVIFCSLFSLPVFADEYLDVCPKCGERTYETWQDLETSLPEINFPVALKWRHCTTCNYTYYQWNCLGFTGYKDFDVGSTGVAKGLLVDYLTDWINKTFGKNATASKFQAGGGSTSGGGAGRYPSGYTSDGVPSIDSSGLLTWQPDFPSSSTDFVKINRVNHNYCSISEYTKSYGNVFCSVSGSHILLSVTPLSGRTTFQFEDISFYNLAFSAPVSGYYSSSSFLCSLQGRASNSSEVSKKRNYSYSGVYFNAGDLIYIPNLSSGYSYVTPTFYANGYQPTYVHSDIYTPVFTITPLNTSITKQPNITINKNTWNGNIYVDNSSNLTYIYPQYTTINESNETVTNISENPIIYNSETNQYYTYDSVTNNYYYITYEQSATPSPAPSTSPDPTATPAPSASPDPGVSPTPTPAPGGDSGSTSGLMEMLQAIKDSIVQGFADLTANIKLSIENLTINIQNFFNKKFPDISTGETAATPTPSPTPSVTPEPIVTPEPSASPVITPTPSPESTDKPSKTTNFWTFIFGGGSDDGTDKGHKGILWALISLILAIISLLTGLGASAKYLFPFLPSSVITTIHICVIVLFLFAVIKFIRSFL